MKIARSFIQMSACSACSARKPRPEREWPLILISGHSRSRSLSRPQSIFSNLSLYTYKGLALAFQVGTLTNESLG